MSAVNPLPPSAIVAQATTTSTADLNISVCTLEELRAFLASKTAAEKKEWVDSTNARGQTYLAVAVEAHGKPDAHKIPNDRKEVIYCLVNVCQADIDKADSTGWHPLYRASTELHADGLFDFILARSEALNRPNSDGSVPLHRLVERGHIAGIENLLHMSALDPNVVNCHGTPATYAAKVNNEVVMQVLLSDPRVDVNKVAAQDSLAATTLDYAKTYDNPAMIALLKCLSLLLKEKQWQMSLLLVRRLRA